MKKGRTLQALATEIDRQRDAMRDFVAPTNRLSMGLVQRPAIQGPDRLRPVLDVALAEDREESFRMTDLFHDQLGAKLGIPKKYYSRMLDEAPTLLQSNVNHWLQEHQGRRLVRTLDGRARAFLSDRYRSLDNHELAEAVLPVLAEQGVEVVSSEITERRMYLKAVNPRVSAEIKRGDVVQAGMAVSNSEVGHGALSVQPLVYRLVCENGMISADAGLRKYHVGRMRGGSDEPSSWEVFRDETRKQSDRALWMQVGDLTRAALGEALFRQLASKLREAAGDRIEGSPVEAVSVVQHQFGLSDGERDGVLRHLIEGGDLSRYGLANAATSYSQEVADYDHATTFERMGGKVIELSRRDWRRIAEAN